MLILQLLVLSFGLIIFFISGLCLIWLIRRKGAMNWSFDKDSSVRASLNSSLWFIANIVIFSTATIMASTIQLSLTTEEWPGFLINQAFRGVKEYFHYLILLRFTISEFYTAKMTYWMACYHTKKTG